MRVLLLTLVALIAFAANSILNRAALAETGMDAASFTGVRILSGAVVLSCLVLLGGGGVSRIWAPGNWASAGALVAYAVAFSFAYLTLDAGVGALILFGAVQMTMFSGALLKGQTPGRRRWIGSGLGLSGLCVLLLPGAHAPPATGALLMLAAGVAWGIYSLRGQAATDPLATTCAHFVRSVPVALPIWLMFGSAGTLSPEGVLLACASGALASGLGYAVWYAALPSLEPSVAAIAQLTVPLIALAGGVVFLSETVGFGFVLASVLILGGVGFGVTKPRDRE